MPLELLECDLERKTPKLLLFEGEVMFIASQLLECDLRQRTPKLPLFWEGIDVYCLSNYLEVTWSGKHPSYLFFGRELTFFISRIT